MPAFLFVGASLVPSYIGKTSSTQLGSGTSVTFTHVTTSDTTFLIVCVQANDSNGSATTSGVTYNSVAMTQAVQGTQAASGGNCNSSIWYMANPPIGSHSVVATGATVDRTLSAQAVNAKGIVGIVDTFGTQGWTSASFGTVTLTTTAPTLVIATVTNTESSSSTNSWINATEFEDINTTGRSSTSAYSAEAAAVTSRGYTASSTNSSTRAVMAAAAFR